MKAILMSIRPQHMANILNGIKTLEIRKRFPSDYVGWVYIYCTKDSKSDKTLCYDSFSGILGFRPNYRVGIADNVLNGKVVARFWCDKMEEINFHASYNEDIRGYRLNNIYSTEKDLLEKSCLTQHELYSYLPHISPCGKAIHITKLEIFDEPKEISEFKTIQKSGWDLGCFHKSDKGTPLTRAPQSWCYVEV